MLIKDKLIRDVAKYLSQPEDMVATIISDSYEQLNKATKQHEELEISGFGILKLSMPKIRKRIARMEKGIVTLTNSLDSCTEEQKEECLMKIENMNKTLTYYKSRLSE